MTAWESHVIAWQNCQRCELCTQRNSLPNGKGGELGVVLGRGQLPCDVLFCGEAPGQSEDVIGVPFIGPAGRLLDQMVERAIGDLVYPGVFDENGDDVKYTWAMTNLVACFPREAKEAGINKPPKESIEACRDRLLEFVHLAQCRLIVCVGELAGAWVPKLLIPTPTHLEATIMVEHPASILRKNVAVQGLSIQQAIVAIYDAVEGLQHQYNSNSESKKDRETANSA